MLLESVRPTCHANEMRSYQTDYRLWAVIATMLFVALGFVNVLGSGTKSESSLWAYFGLLAEGGNNTRFLLVAIVVQSLCLAAPAIAVGWLIQAVAVLCGARLTRYVAPDEPSPSTQP